MKAEEAMLVALTRQNHIGLVIWATEKELVAGGNASLIEQLAATALSMTSAHHGIMMNRIILVCTTGDPCQASWS